MTAAPHTVSWPYAQLGEAIEALARKARLASQPVELPSPPTDLLPSDLESLDRWVEGAAGALGVEAEPIETPYAEVEQLISGAGPALLCLPAKGRAVFLAVLGCRHGCLTVLGPDLSTHRVEAEAVRQALCRPMEQPVLEKVDRLLTDAGVPRRRQHRARAVILREQLDSARIHGCWLFRLPPGGSFWQQLRRARIPRHLGAFVGSHAAQHILVILAWWAIGWGALSGRLETGWLIAWAILLASHIPLRLLMIWAQGQLAYGVSGVFKQRLLFGALRIDPQVIRRQGTGHLLGRVIESEALETLAVNGAFMGLVAVVEVITALAVLWIAAAGGLLVPLFAVWLALALLGSLWFYQHRKRWTCSRLTMTDDLTERMIGHRTRIAQQTAEHLHDGEDQILSEYVARSIKMDNLAAFLLGGLVRGWIVVALLALAPTFALSESSPSALAVAIGGVLLGARALGRISGSLAFLTDALISWEQVAPLFRAARDPETQGSAEFALALQAQPRTIVDHRRGDGQPVIEAYELAFRYRERGEPVLTGCNLRVNHGDRLLLEGPSGSGKSTLASLLCGLRVPESGLILLRGLDLHTVGASTWRHRVVAAPQFHENHILTGTLAFNLLMGRRWPALPADFEEAEAVCRELGLGPLIDRMPAGLRQMVGETGWQLSHGERTRVYIARALLQGADLIVLDESFAALDAETLRLSLNCVLNRTRTLLVIAHP